MLCGKIMRTITLGKDSAIKAKLEPATLGGQGWKLSGEWWSKQIPVVQFYTAEHRDGGVPEVGTPGLDDLIACIRSAVLEHDIAPDVMVKAINNGLYLDANGKAKPKATTSLAGIEAVYMEEAGRNGGNLPMFMALQAAITASNKEKFLKDWWAKRDAQAA